MTNTHLKGEREVKKKGLSSNQKITHKNANAPMKGVK